MWPMTELITSILYSIKNTPPKEDGILIIVLCYGIFLSLSRLWTTRRKMWWSLKQIISQNLLT
jgi:hypothetical protein